MKYLKKIFKIFFTAAAVILFFDILVVLLFAVLKPPVKKADAIIVMGAAINSPALYNRSLEALDLYEQGYAPVLVLSGGRISSEDISEAKYMQRTMQAKAGKPLNFILDEEAGNTYENISNAKHKLSNAKSVIIVTDKFHLARSVITAKVVGFKHVYWSPPETKYPGSQLRYYYTREVVANIAYLPKYFFR